MVFFCWWTMAIGRFVFVPFSYLSHGWCLGEELVCELFGFLLLSSQKAPSGLGSMPHSPPAPLPAGSSLRHRLWLRRGPRGLRHQTLRTLQHLMHVHSGFWNPGIGTSPFAMRRCAQPADNHSLHRGVWSWLHAGLRPATTITVASCNAPRYPSFHAPKSSRHMPSWSPSPAT